MTQVFISYRHISPDQDLAGFLEGYLKSRGLDVFIDTQMLVGDKWVEEIERRIRASSFFIALLSADSIRSDMVRQEVELAHSLPNCAILPVRVSFEGALPYDLASYLNRIQYAQWKSREDNQTIAEQIFAAIDRSASLPNQGQSGETQSSAAELQALADATENRGAPLPAADPRLMFDTGAVRVGSPFYIQRDADAQMAKEVQREGQTIIVKGMRQMGKSSLLATAVAAAKRRQSKTFYYDFQRLGPDQLDSLDSLLRYLAQRLARDLKATIKPAEIWDETLSAKDNLTYFIEDATRTPFNIGHRIDLTDFTFEEAKPLARGLGATEDRGEQALRRILRWTGGHPYLTQKLCQTMAQEQPPGRQERQEKKGDDANKVADTTSFDSSWLPWRPGGDISPEFIDSIVEAELLSPQASLNDSNLNFVRDRVTKGGRLTPEMLKLYRRIRRGGKVIDDTRSPVHSGLKLSGLIVQSEDRSLRVRNLVYERVFTHEWAKKAMPVDRRQRIAVLSAAATLLIGFGVWYTLFLPREYVRGINNAADDVPADAYNRLHRLPGFGGKADELMAQFWERRALGEEGVGKRDEALLSRLQAVAAKSTDLRRSEANLLIGSDYNNLQMTYRYSEPVIAVAFSPDGKLVLTGSDDRTARLWRVDSGQLLSTLGHDSSVSAVDFSPDGKYAMAMTDNWIHFSSVTEGGLIHRASRRVPGLRNRDFHFDSSDGSRLRIAWLPTGDSIKIDTLRFDTLDAPPIEGDPKTLLDDWMKRLALKFDERWKIVPSQPVETVKNER